VGRDVDSIIRDLAEVAVKLKRDEAMQGVQEAAKDNAEERVLDALIRPPKSSESSVGFAGEPADKDSNESTQTREIFRKKLREGKLDDKEIELEVASAKMGVEIMAPPGMEEMSNQLQSLFQSMGGDRKKRKKMPVKHALKMAQEEEASKLINEDEIKSQAIENLEQHGIVFIDEIDKVTRSESGGNVDVSREGVQRDLLPLIEGSNISTKYGMIKTDHILFIASGAFHMSKPADLIPELQGRLPTRVELQALTADDFVRILTEPNAALTQQYKALLNVENVDLQFTKDGIQRIAEIATDVNNTTENIGARRLHTIMEKLLEHVAYNADEYTNNPFYVDAKYVDKILKDLSANQDLTDYIL
jgi:ATP-dependent HslUV protease ATP-binding subunit HslU